MERLKIEEIANNYGMHLKDFAQRKVLADQINFALDFGMEYYQGGFQFSKIISDPVVQIKWESYSFLWQFMLTNWLQNITDHYSKPTEWKPKKFVLDEQISQLQDKLTDIEYELNLTAWKTKIHFLNWRKSTVILNGIILILSRPFLHVRINDFLFWVYPNK